MFLFSSLACTTYRCDGARPRCVPLFMFIIYGLINTLPVSQIAFRICMRHGTWRKTGIQVEVGSSSGQAFHFTHWRTSFSLYDGWHDEEVFLATRMMTNFDKLSRHDARARAFGLCCQNEEMLRTNKRIVFTECGVALYKRMLQVW